MVRVFACEGGASLDGGICGFSEMISWDVCSADVLGMQLACLGGVATQLPLIGSIEGREGC